MVKVSNMRNVAALILMLYGSVTLATELNSNLYQSTPSHSSKQQSYYLNKAHDVASDVGTVPPEIVQGILIQESKGGQVPSLVGSRSGGVGHRSYGVMQIKVEAARSVLIRYPDLLHRYFHNVPLKNLTDEEIIVVLMTNHEANIRIGCYHLITYFKIVKQWDKAIVAYNIGIGNALKMGDASNHHYLHSVKNNIKRIVRPHNQDIY